MEEVFLRFPHLIVDISNNLDNESLVQCKVVSKIWSHYLDQQKFLEIRKIETKIQQFHTVGDDWKIFFNKATLKILKDFWSAINKFYCLDPTLTFNVKITPLHVAAAFGNIQLFMKIEEKVKKIMSTEKVKSPKVG